MANTPIPDGRLALRQDLTSIQVSGRLRPYRIVIDEISGRFARVSEHIWTRLQRGDEDPELWTQAKAAGWLRHRTQLPKRRFSLLSIQIPLGSVDWLAKRLADYSGIFFSPRAIVFWLVGILLIAATVVSRSDQLFASLGLLPAYLRHTNPLLIAALFVATKTIHELAHAVMCRRLGNRCGEIGVLLLCGMPCPYCEVTEIWRQPSSIKRAWVMLAGIYAELIIAALAALAWLTSYDLSTQLAALNVMLVCGVSTIVFNANPLMRYDGYYVLSDLLGSVNLRHEARVALAGVVTRRVAGTKYAAAKRSDRRSLFLACFHIASALYRVAVAAAIAALLIRYSEWFGLRTAAFSVIAIVALIAIARFFASLGRILAGKGRWRDVSLPRRIGPVGLFMMFLLFLLLVPLPRYRRAVGVIDVANARSVFLPDDALVEDVLADFGQLVDKGDTLVRLDRDVLIVHQVKLQGDLRLAQIRSDVARRMTLDNTHASRPKTAAQWKTLQAAEEAAHTQLASTRQRIADANVRAPASGVVVPPSASLNESPQQNTLLADTVGTSLPAGHAWCRVSENGELQAALVLDAQDRRNIRIGSTVMISSTQSPQTVIKSKVVAVSAIKQINTELPEGAAYQVLCPLPAVDDQQLIAWVGQECRGVFRLPHRTLASGLTEWLKDWFRG